MTDKPLTQERLKELLHYDPLTGVFTRKVSSRYRWHTGEVAGSLEKNGYTRMYVEGRQYRAHRLAFLYMNGVFPEKDIDHKFGDNSDTSFINLRIASKSENLQNAKLRTDNTSGAKGVSYRKDRDTYSVRVLVNDFYKSFGCYKDLELAELVAIEARNKYHGEFARHI